MFVCGEEGGRGRRAGARCPGLPPTLLPTHLPLAQQRGAWRRSSLEQLDHPATDGLQQAAPCVKERLHHVHDAHVALCSVVGKQAWGSGAGWGAPPRPPAHPPPTHTCLLQSIASVPLRAVTGVCASCARLTNSCAMASTLAACCQKAWGCARQLASTECQLPSAAAAARGWARRCWSTRSYSPSQHMHRAMSTPNAHSWLAQQRGGAMGGRVTRCGAAALGARAPPWGLPLPRLPPPPEATPRSPACSAPPRRQGPPPAHSRRNAPPALLPCAACRAPCAPSAPINSSGRAGGVGVGSRRRLSEWAGAAGASPGRCHSSPRRRRAVGTPGHAGTCGGWRAA